MTKHKILVVGSGGRDHVLAWALAHSSQVEQIYVAPGNGGTQWPAGTEEDGRGPRAAATNIPIAMDNLSELVRFARQEEIALTIIGPTTALVTGVVDAFQDAGLPVFGPCLQASQLEISKAFAKNFMRHHNIPTADYRIFDDYRAAKDYLRTASRPVVVKADGLADGKGVIVCDDADQALAALDKIMIEQVFGAAGKKVVIEERLEGPEISILAWSDGQTVVPTIPARDHKRLFDGDRGPNTGGMGAYAPAPDISAAQIDLICRSILEPTIRGIAAQDTPYIGVLYAGLMLTEAGPKVLEFNCRFGDPEAQAVLPLLKTDLFQILLACIDGRLDQLDICWRTEACATVVLTSPGYPGQFPTGLPISGLDRVAALENIEVFHSGTRRIENDVVTAGGRVLAVSGVGHDLPTALDRAYQGAAQIHFEGAHYRRDIGSAYM
jgi:phosphoribosylamine--glycine ligase